VWNGVVLRVNCYPRGGEEKSPEAAPTRFAVVLSKKQYKTTAARNRFKRQVLSLLSLKLNEFDRFRFGRYVIFPKIPAESISFQEITTDISSLITQCSR
jgi:ribonuclease P protein component